MIIIIKQRKQVKETVFPLMEPELASFSATNIKYISCRVMQKADLDMTCRVMSVKVKITRNIQACSLFFLSLCSQGRERKMLPPLFSFSLHHSRYSSSFADCQGKKDAEPLNCQTPSLGYWCQLWGTAFETISAERSAQSRPWFFQAVYGC